MKKYAIALLALLAVACSSNEPDDDPTQGLHQYLVDYEMSKDQLEFSIPEYNPYRVNSDDPIRESLGLGGLLIYDTGNGYRVCDQSCPVEWTYNLKEKPTIWLSQETSGILACNKCKSEFSATTFEPISGAAKDKGYRLVEYKMELNSYTYGDCYNITNQNFKK